MNYKILIILLIFINNSECITFNECNKIVNFIFNNFIPKSLYFTKPISKIVCNNIKSNNSIINDINKYIIINETIYDNVNEMINNVTNNLKIKINNIMNKNKINKNIIYNDGNNDENNDRNIIYNDENNDKNNDRNIIYNDGNICYLKKMIDI